MSETLIPTMSFRWMTTVKGAQINGPTLEQLHHRPSGGSLWVEVPQFVVTKPTQKGEDDGRA